MQFLWPEVLWLLLLAPALVGAYVLMLRRRKKAAVRYASLMLIRDVIGAGQRIRRHLPPALVLLGLIAAIVAVARPTATVTLPAQYMTIALAMDVSRSMQATDVEPDRLTAAQIAAKSFINDLPKNVRLGIVSFAGTAAVVQTPTENRDDMMAAIDRFQLQRATATGSGLLLALSLLFPDDGLDLEAAVFDGRFGFGARPTVFEKRKSAEQGKSASHAHREPVKPGSYTGGVIILLSDGRRTTGPDPLAVARMAADRGVRVYTVGFGTREGATIDFGSYSFYVRLDEETLKAVAKMTGGEYYHAGSAVDLRKVYETLNTRISLETRNTEISALLVGAAALLFMLGALLSLLWFHRGAPPRPASSQGG
jgi:Ca-activated chloride channel family protein